MKAFVALLVIVAGCADDQPVPLHDQEAEVQRLVLQTWVDEHDELVGILMRTTGIVDDEVPFLEPMAERLVGEHGTDLIGDLVRRNRRSIALPVDQLGDFDGHVRWAGPEDEEQLATIGYLMSNSGFDGASTRLELNRPGFSADGRRALVLLESVTGICGITHLWLLERGEAGWRVVTRHN